MKVFGSEEAAAKTFAGFKSDLILCCPKFHFRKKL